ncbi:phosphatase 2C-like domain-containing protein [Crepidotus variabilis]|uniref:Phosphatase 2C-like domain-containing protein n=1 Tax=Crepidotus variabilis TaxID=179855 RepID=A0A9P6EKR0_9AGAR|nr:phosphatase 2C-like domain-containing protein [Crepidotus variabilis]
MENIVGQVVSPTLDNSKLPARLIISVAQLQPTDRPIEDRFSIQFDPVRARFIVGVYDGHGGPETADHISRELPRQLFAQPPACHAQQFMQLDDSILTDFKRDHSFFRSKSSEWIHHAQLIKSGSTALILDIDMDSLVGYYSNSGDCRLVICSSSQGPDLVIMQTQDLNAKTPSEKDRLAQEHPDEDPIIVGGRLFGRLMCTRGFGDGYYKLPKGPFGEHRKFIETLSSAEMSTGGKVSMISQYSVYFYAYKTPPYITARPESGVCQLKDGDIAILASDGLWDLISSSEAADIVLRGAGNNELDLAKYLIEQVTLTKSPSDDVTVVVLQV